MFVTRRKEEYRVLDVAIIGSGPAGLSAAVYSSRAGLSTLIYIGKTKGGLLTTTEKVDNYLGLYDSTGMDLAENFLEHSTKFGAETTSATVESIHVDSDNIFHIIDEKNQETLAKAVIYAAGSNPRKLGVKGEDLESVSYCANCDGFFFEDEKVVVVGGGETAAEDALYLSNICESVDVLVRSSWRATEPAVHKLEEQDNVTIHVGVNVSEILEKDGDVSGVLLDNGETVESHAVFVAVGQEPNSQVAERHASLYEDGFIRCSNVDGFFIAGDIQDPDYRQVIIAAGDGAKAGIDATRYVLNN